MHCNGGTREHTTILASVHQCRERGLSFHAVLIEDTAERLGWLEPGISLYAYSRGRQLAG